MCSMLPQMKKKLKKTYFMIHLIKNKNLRTIKKLRLVSITEKINSKIVDAVMIIDLDYIFKNIKLNYLGRRYDTVKEDYDM